MMQSIIWIIVILIMAAVSGCSGDSALSKQKEDQKEPNIMIIKKYVDEILNKGNLDVADEIIAEDFVDPAAAPGEKGPESLKKVISSFRSIFPDLSVTIDEMVVDGENVAWKWTAEGTHQGVIFGIAPTNMSVRFCGIIIDTIRDGKIRRRQGIWDRMGLKTQLLRK